MRLTVFIEICADEPVNISTEFYQSTSKNHQLSQTYARTLTHFTLTNNQYTHTNTLLHDLGPKGVGAPPDKKSSHNSNELGLNEQSFFGDTGVFDVDSEERSDFSSISTLAALLFTVCGVTFFVVHLDRDGSCSSFLVILYPADLVCVGFRSHSNRNKNSAFNLSEQIESFDVIFAGNREFSKVGGFGGQCDGFGGVCIS